MIAFFPKLTRILRALKISAIQINMPDLQNTCPKCSGLRGQWDAQCRQCGFMYAELDKKKKEEAAQKQEIRAGCPACNASRKEGDLECPFCGAVYAKFKKRIEAQREADLQRSADIRNADENISPEQVAAWKHAGRERSAWLTLILIATIGVNFLVAWIGFAQGHIGIAVIASMMIVFAIAVFSWKKWGVYGIYIFCVLGIGASILTKAHPFFILRDIAIFLIFMSSVRSVYQHFE